MNVSVLKLNVVIACSYFAKLNNILICKASLPVTTKHRENVAVISSNNSLLYLMRTGSQCYAGHATCFVSP